MDDNDDDDEAHSEDSIYKDITFSRRAYTTTYDAYTLYDFQREA